ncbi:hypothetical protein [Streptomyces sp. NPDC003006]
MSKTQATVAMRLRLGFSPRGQASAPPGRLTLGRGPAGGFAQGLGAHHHALLVDLDDQRHFAGARGGDLRRVVGGDVDGGGDREFFEAALAQHSSTSSLDRGGGLVV